MKKDKMIIHVIKKFSNLKTVELGLLMMSTLISCRILGSHYSDIRGNHRDTNSAFQWKRSVAENYELKVKVKINC